jgi:hypothetical protein
MSAPIKRSYPARYVQQYGVGYLDGLMRTYWPVFEKFDVKSSEDRVQLALSWQKDGPGACEEWQERQLESRKQQQLTALKQELTGTSDVGDKILAGLKIASVKALDVAKAVAEVPVQLGEAALADPLDPRQGLEKKARKAKEKKLNRRLATGQGGWVTDAGPGIKKFEKGMLGFDLYVVNKGLTLGEAQAVIGELRPKDAPVQDVECFIVPQTGFRVVKEQRHLAEWFSANKDRYLVRSWGSGGEYDEKLSRRAKQVDAAYDRGGRVESTTEQERKKKEVEQEQARLREHVRVDDLTGQPGERSKARLAVEVGPFRALLSDEEQFEVISQGSLVLNLLKRALGIAVGPLGGLGAQKVAGEEVAKTVEGAKKTVDAVEAGVNALEFLDKTAKAKLKGTAPTFVEIVFSWQGGQASVPTKASYEKCQTTVFVQGQAYQGIRIGDMKRRLV